MDPPFSGLVLDPSKCREMSPGEKKEVFLKLAKRPEKALEMLCKWTRRDLLEILCVEAGKERKFTGLPKQKLIECLLQIESEKKSLELIQDDKSPSRATPPKRQRKSDRPSRLHVATSYALPKSSEEDEALDVTCYCANTSLRQEDLFCKRCSCCICHKYDDNKDPSLWLVCQWETESCGVSCHLDCALKDERAGITGDGGGNCTRLDGSYYCVYCGKVNDLLRCWKRQLTIARDTQRVDVLRHRVSLSHQLLFLTKKYRWLHELVDSAMKKLDGEVGTLDGSSCTARGIIDRLSVNSDVQRLCAQAVEALDSFQEFQTQRAGIMSSGIVRVEDVSPTSLALIFESQGNLLSSEEPVGYALWYRKADEDYPIEPKFRIHEAQRSRFLVTDLAQGTNYVFKLVAFCNARELGEWEVRARTNCASKADDSSSNSHSTSPKQSCDISSGVSNSPSEGYESNNAVTFQDLNKSPDSCCGEKSDIMDLGKSPDDRGLPISALVEEPNSTIQASSRGGSTTSAEQNEVAVVPIPANELPAPLHNQIADVTYDCRLGTRREASTRITYAKPSGGSRDNGPKRSERELLTGSLAKKRGDDGVSCAEAAIVADGSLEREEFQCCVKAIRRLEREGHIEANFRLKFLTWFGLRATPQERRIVTVFVDTMNDDPKSLTGQLVDTFSEALRRKRTPPSPAGFCSRIWH